MPTYQYLCNDCGHTFEEFQRISAEALTVCPECGGHIERVISGGAGFIFKGSGFYITEHRSQSYKDAARKDVTSTSSSSSSSETSSSSKTPSPSTSSPSTDQKKSTDK